MLMIASVVLHVMLKYPVISDSDTDRGLFLELNSYDFRQGV